MSSLRLSSFLFLSVLCASLIAPAFAEITAGVSVQVFTDSRVCSGANTNVSAAITTTTPALYAVDGGYIDVQCNGLAFTVNVWSTAPCTGGSTTPSAPTTTATGTTSGQCAAVSATGTALSFIVNCQPTPPLQASQLSAQSGVCTAVVTTTAPTTIIATTVTTPSNLITALQISEYPASSTTCAAGTALLQPYAVSAGCVSFGTFSASATCTAMSATGTYTLSLFTDTACTTAATSVTGTSGSCKAATVGGTGYNFAVNCAASTAVVNLAGTTTPAPNGQGQVVAGAMASYASAQACSSAIGGTGTLSNSIYLEEYTCYPFSQNNGVFSARLYCTQYSSTGVYSLKVFDGNLCSGNAFSVTTGQSGSCSSAPLSSGATFTFTANCGAVVASSQLYTPNTQQTNGAASVSASVMAVAAAIMLAALRLF